MKLPHPLHLGAGLGHPLRLAQPSCKDASCSWTWMLARWTANSRCLAWMHRSMMRAAIRMSRGTPMSA